MINMDFTKIAYRATDNDVRIYMETSNGIQMNNKDYSKLQVSGEEEETFRSYDSQSQDYELTPPKSDSYTNLFDAGQDVPLGGSAHSLRNHLVAGHDSSLPVSTSLKPLPVKALYPSRNTPATSVSSVLHHGPPSSGHRLDPYSDGAHHLPTKTMTTGSPTVISRGSIMLASDESYQAAHSLVKDHFTPAHKTSKQSPPSSISGLSRIVSLTGARTSPVGTHYQCTTSGHKPLNERSTTNGSDLPNSRPLLLKDSLAHFSDTSPSLFAATNSSDSRTALLKSVAPVDAPGINNIPGAVRRPMSFVKALEVSDQLTVHDKKTKLRQPQQLGLQKEVMAEEEESEKQAHSSSYEIAV